jgi:hypothetical protein
MSCVLHTLKAETANHLDILASRGTESRAVSPTKLNITFMCVDFFCALYSSRKGHPASSIDEDIPSGTELRQPYSKDRTEFRD